MDATLLLTALVFTLAGLVKGVIGLGLPTVAMGLLSLVMPPAEAAALLVLPSLVTNLWQLAVGPALLPLLRRFGPMMAAVLVGTVTASGVVAGSSGAGLAPLGGLGVALVAYGLLGLFGPPLAMTPRTERRLGPAVGLATGLVTGATGVFVLPAVPFLAAAGLGKDGLVQALGLSFTVSTLALAAGLALHGALPGAALLGSGLAVLPALAGMWLGGVLRARASPVLFRRCFFGFLLLLGAELAARAVR